MSVLLLWATWLPLARGDAAALFIVPLFFAFFIGIIALGIYSHKKAKERWMQFARTYGLTHNPAGWGSQSHMSGWFDGIYVHIGTVTRGSGKNRHTYTQFQAMLANGVMPYGLQIYQETIFSKVGVFFGGQDIQLGDQQLDSAFVFKGNNPADVHRLVTIPAVRGALFDMLSRQPNFVLDSNRVMVEKNGFVSDIGVMYTTLVACVQLVQVLHGVCGVGVPPPAQTVPVPAPVELPVAIVPPPKAAKPAAPAPRQAPPPGPRPDNTPRGDGGTFVLFDKLGDGALGSAERDALLEKLKTRPVSVPVVIDRVDYTSSFDVPENLKDGRTVLGTINGLKTKVAVRFPKSRDRDVVNLRRGEPMTVQAKVTSWDALFDRLNVDAA
jgi:hypothetical protein